MAETNNPYQDKIDQDKKNLIQLRAGTANEQLMNAAYLGARQEPPAVTTWMNAAESGFTSFTEAIDKGKKARQAEVDKMNGDIDTQIDTLTTTGFSLGETYYGAANEYTKQLREKYLAAEGDPEAQNKIKMELNVASQNIGTTKQAIEDIATAWGVNEDESTLERSALNQSQRDIIKTVTNDANAVWDYEENTFVWKNPENGETYTAKDINDIQKIASRDYVGKEDYIKYEQSKAEGGMLFHQDGTGEPFNPTKETFANEKRITKENINFYINGDFTNDGTKFKDEFQKHPDFNLDDPNNVIFKVLTESGKYDHLDKGGMDSSIYPQSKVYGNAFRTWMKWKYPNFKHEGEPLNKSGAHDNKYIKAAWDKHAEEYATAVSGSRVKGFDLRDMPDPTPDDGEYTKDDLAILAQNVYNAITDETAGGYDFDVSKNLIAEYMTLRQKEKFYGGKIEDIEKINPEDFTSLDSYIAKGGSVGYAQQVMGYRWVPKDPNGTTTKEKNGYWEVDPSKGYKAKFSGTVL